MVPRTPSHSCRKLLRKAAFGPLGMMGLIKCNADPACLPPNDVTMMVTMLGFNDKIKRTGDADLAFDFKIRTAD
jgi:hypothetical protein